MITAYRHIASNDNEFLFSLRMHFLHLMVYDDNKVGKQHYPVLLLHGWPGSVREFYDFIHLVHQSHLDKNNKYIFNVIVPSLPGYGWSQVYTLLLELIDLYSILLCAPIFRVPHVPAWDRLRWP